ncbi:MAG: FAD:protein FMN transferase [Bifidobacteriaceae bacterium]|nr:FAD:protein FMN transferase [Bifidobacteriaceae bacterium]
MTKLLPFTTIFPKALGTGIIIQSSQSLDKDTYDYCAQTITQFENNLSRFLENSIVSQISRANQGGSFTFPQYCEPLFENYDMLFSITHGAIDPCIGEDLSHIGYDATLRFTLDADENSLGAIHGRTQWNHLPSDTNMQTLNEKNTANDLNIYTANYSTENPIITRNRTILRTTQNVQLDFGACGKGLLVDILFHTLHNQHGINSLLINAGGDIRCHTPEPIIIGLEDPNNTDNAIGQIAIKSGAICASAPSRRHWQLASGQKVHHILNAIDGLPSKQTAATWVYINEENTYATMFADGLSTALFVDDAHQIVNEYLDYMKYYKQHNKHTDTDFHMNFPSTFPQVAILYENNRVLCINKHDIDFFTS